MKRTPWNKGLKGFQTPWNKGKKLPQFSGPNHPNWKGGRYRSSNGYYQVYDPDHPFSNKDGYVLEHRLVVEKSIGRFLDKKEVVHHINNKPSDNRLENLQLLENDLEHRRIHSGKYKKENGKLLKYCNGCKAFLEVKPRNFYINKNCVASNCKRHHGK